MKLLTQHTYYLLSVISLILALNFKGCRDLEDCRSIYTNAFDIGFKSESEVKLDKIVCDEPISEIIYDKNRDNDMDKDISKQLKDKKLHLNFLSNHNMIRLLFHRTLSNAGAPVATDTVTIFYQRIPSMLSPNCGLQEEYIIKRVETTFAGNKIIKPTLRSIDYEGSNPEELKKPNIEIYY